jgi:6-phosphogluconolactonase
MKMEVFADADEVARQGAAVVAAAARDAVVARGRFIMAVSGGKTPWVMLRALAGEKVPWEQVHVVQVDERVAPAEHPDRNLTHLRQSLLTRVPLAAEQIHAGGSARPGGRSQAVCRDSPGDCRFPAGT